jgi:hypothetical protein
MSYCRLIGLTFFDFPVEHRRRLRINTRLALGVARSLDKRVEDLFFLEKKP